jgi:hypothetical protein
MQRHCEYCMHKDNRDYKNAKERRDRVVVTVEENSGVDKEAERRSRNAQSRNGALKGYAT